MKKTHKDSISKFQDNLKQLMVHEAIDSEIINNVLESGFFLINGYVADGYYGLRSKIPVEVFTDIVKGNSNLEINHDIPTYEIDSIDEAYKILNQPQYERFKNDLCFRGQTNNYTATRPFPHPFFSNKDGKELLLLPGFWRKYLNENNHVKNERPEDRRPSFLDMLKDELIFHGIDLEELNKNNLNTYGPHFHSEIEDFPDVASQEYWKRYLLKIYSPNFSLLEQHYGIDTVGLDVTFDIKVALFFATHAFNFNPVSNRGHYKKINENHTGVVYIIRFSSPKLMKTRDMITNIPDWNHLYPLRPIMQSCALPFFDHTRVNEAVPHVIGIIKIQNNFNFENSYKATDLFPDKHNDNFYKVLLELKEKYPSELRSIIDYDSV